MKLRKWYRLNRDKAIIFPLTAQRKEPMKMHFTFQVNKQNNADCVIMKSRQSQ